MSDGPKKGNLPIIIGLILFVLVYAGRYWYVITSDKFYYESLGSLKAIFWPVMGGNNIAAALILLPLPLVLIIVGLVIRKSVLGKSAGYAGLSSRRRSGFWLTVVGVVTFIIAYLSVSLFVGSFGGNYFLGFLWPFIPDLMYFWLIIAVPIILIIVGLLMNKKSKTKSEHE